MKSNNLAIKYLKSGLSLVLIFTVLIMVDTFKPRKKYIFDINESCYTQSKVIIWNNKFTNYLPSVFLTQLNLNQGIISLRDKGLKVSQGKELSRAQSIIISYDTLKYESKNFSCDKVNRLVAIALQEVKKKTNFEINEYIKSKRTLLKNMTAELSGLRTKSDNFIVKIKELELLNEHLAANNKNAIVIIHAPTQTCPFGMGRCKSIIDDEKPLLPYIKYIAFLIFSAVIYALYLFSKNIIFKNVKMFLREFNKIILK